MKKYAIFAIAMLLVVGLGSFQYWAVGSQLTASATVGSVDTTGVTVTAGDPAPVLVPHPVITGKPGPVGNTSYELYNTTLAETTYKENYTATVHLTNADVLGESYTYLNMKVELKNYNATSGNDVSNITSKWLTLENGRVQLTIDRDNFNSSFPAKIYITDGNYYIPEGESSGADPSFVIDVEMLDVNEW